MSYISRLQSIIQNKLAPRATGTTVGVGGVAVSGSSGSFSTGSNTPTSVTNMSVTITTTGRPVLILVQTDGTTNGSSFLPSSNSNGFLEVFRGATGLGIYPATSPSTALNYPGCLVISDVVTAGTYTYTLKAFTTTGGATIGVNNCVLVAFET